MNNQKEKERAELHKTIWNRVYEKLSLFFDKFFDLSKKDL